MPILAEKEREIIRNHKQFLLSVDFEEYSSAQQDENEETKVIDWSKRGTNKTGKKTTEKSIYRHVQVVASTDEIFPEISPNLVYRAYRRKNGHDEKIPYNEKNIKQIFNRVKITCIEILKAW